MDFLQLLDSPILNLITGLGDKVYCFFAYFGELLRVPLTDNTLPSDFLNVSFYSPFTETINTINFNSVVSEVSSSLSWLINNLVTTNNATTFNYLYEVILYTLPILSIVFFVIAIITNVIKMIL